MCFGTKAHKNKAGKLSLDTKEHIGNMVAIPMFMEVPMVLVSTIVFLIALLSAFGAIGVSVLGAKARIDAVLASRGQAAERTIRIGAPRSGWKLA
jgi:hypothetical protein